MSQQKPSPEDFRRFLGYTIITFLSVFLFIPVVWFVQLFSPDQGLYTRWGISSAFLVILNLLFYYWDYPKNWLQNLLVLIVLDLLVLIFEYFWLTQGRG